MNGSPRIPARLPRRRRFAVTLLGLLAIFVAACGSSPAAEPSATASPSLAPPSAAPSVAAALPSIEPFDHGEIPAEIVGRYTFVVFEKEMVVDLESDGTYLLSSGMRTCCPFALVPGDVEVRGAYGVFGDEMRFGNEVAVEGRACPPGDGVYTWSLDDGELTLAVVEDPCGDPINRIAEWEAGWDRAD